MLSFSKVKGYKSRPVALVKGGKNDGKIVYINEESWKTKDLKPMIKTDNIFTIISESQLRKAKKNMTPLQFDTLVKALIKKVAPKNNDLAVIYQKEKKIIEEKSIKEFHLTDGTLSQIPMIPSDEAQRDNLFIAGPSGSGKSTYASEYIRLFKKLYPDRNIIIFSRVDHDPALDIYNPTRIMINEELVDDPIDPVKELSNSLVIFDDIDTIKDKAQRNAVTALRDDILETGRHANIFVITTSHQLCNWKATKASLNEANSITFFPKSGARNQMIRCLKDYCGIEKKDVKRILDLPSRWVTILRRYPQTILYESGIFLL